MFDDLVAPGVAVRRNNPYNPKTTREQRAKYKRHHEIN